MHGGVDWDSQIENKLRNCDIFILLVSAHSMASDYIVDKEIAIIRERQKRGDPVHFYPLLLSPTPKVGLDRIRDKNLRPHGAKPFSSYSAHDREQHMTDIANEIVNLVEQLEKRKNEAQPHRLPAPTDIHVSGLPETNYERLVGRDADLQRLDEAWGNTETSIVSLIAEGGAGKSAILNEWLKRLQKDSYRGADAVLGWSFYSQGSKERATSTDEFLNWALAKLSIKIATNSATAKAEAIAEAMAQRRVLLLLDGVEPLQHGPGLQFGQLKDPGLRALLRRFAATPSGLHGLVVLTSRLAVKDIARWRDRAAPVLNVEQLTDEAGATLLRDNAVWGSEAELKTAAREFGGHPLALGLLASFLNETRLGDVRRRDNIRGLLDDTDNPGHDHAHRVMESYEKEWLIAQPALLAIMHIVGVFDRPASGDCLRFLRKSPVVDGDSDPLIPLSDDDWNRAVKRLRDARLLAPVDPSEVDAIDAHPLIREWFGERFRTKSRKSWQAAHGRLHRYLCEATAESDAPTLEELAPLYQAIAHGCRAGLHQQVFKDIYINRICRRSHGEDRNIEYYAFVKLGAAGTELAALSWFFEKPYERTIATLSSYDAFTVQRLTANCLRAQGRLMDALPIQYGQLDELQSGRVHGRARQRGRQARAGAISRSMFNLSQTELLIGNIVKACSLAIKSEEVIAPWADRVMFRGLIRNSQTAQANALFAAGNASAVEALFSNRERQHGKRGRLSYLISDFLLARSDYLGVVDHGLDSLTYAQSQGAPLGIGLSNLAVARANLGLALKTAGEPVHKQWCQSVLELSERFDIALQNLRAAGGASEILHGLLARSVFRRSLGDWSGAAHDLDEVEEIAEPGPMRLFLCDLAIERARLAFARLEAFAPLYKPVDDALTTPRPLEKAERARLHDEAADQLAGAANYLEAYGYHRRDAVIAELQVVLRGESSFASLPPRV
jgi:hypothetical protein